ncbi:unnamed protein product [Larinioides sclopetarius]|uniref:Uncharacterized protein n=1 Tax=Larinioides sclopetarius TaxID=280406 RepID=A0AAV2AW05_9ARAC
MLRSSAFRFASLITKNETGATTFLISKCSYSKSSDEARVQRMFNDQQSSYYTAKDVEFCPGRAKEIMQNNVQETSEQASGNEPVKKTDSTSTQAEEEHMKAYRANNSVSLYSVMQSNVPEPYNTREKAPTNLNMPGGSSTRDYKYLSGKMQTTHHSRQ